jgi:hypothetical protein
MGPAGRAQGRRMPKFRDMLSWEERRLSQLKAAELLGCPEHQFRRYRDRSLDDGEEGLEDRRLGKPLLRAIAASERAAILALYRARHRGWTAKHVHDWGKRQHGFACGYTWTKTQLHAAGLLQRAPRHGVHRRKRERKPCAGMMLHQDGSPRQWVSSHFRDTAARSRSRSPGHLAFEAANRTKAREPGRLRHYCTDEDR